MEHLLKVEAVVVLDAVKALLTLLVVFGVVLTQAQVGALLGVVATGLALFGALTKVTRDHVWSEESHVEEVIAADKDLYEPPVTA